MTALAGLRSEYFMSLSEDARKRYAAKLESVGLVISDDPYLPENNVHFTSEMRNWPNLEFGHIFTYFVTRPGLFTQEQLMSWKQLEAYNYYKSGHVRTIFCRFFGRGGRKFVLLKALVNPSQKSPDKANSAWVITKPDGTIICGHCTCMAGLGESCSHVAAVLFKVECAVRLGHTSVTAQKCLWNESFVSKITPSTVLDINFKRPKCRREEDSCSAALQPTPVLDQDHEHRLFSELETHIPDAVVLSSVIPVTVSKKQVIRKLPFLLTSLERRENLLLNKEELEKLCQTTFHKLSITSEESQYLEEATRLQSLTSLWFEHRKGRITASKFHAVRVTSISSPSVSLLKSFIGNQTSKSATIPSLQWGIENEEIARKAYIDTMSDGHCNISFMPAGLHVNPDFPHLGASPDGIIECDCCGDGLIEIKCPFKYRHLDPNLITDASFYIKRNIEGDIIGLSHDHEYFYQVQGQLSICSKDYCDFIVWTPKGLYIERILKSESFFDQLKPHLDTYFLQILLPVLLTGTIDTVVPSKDSLPVASSSKEIFCLCGGKDEGRMIACDNNKCSIEWYHYKCVGISCKPKGKWYCSTNCKTGASN
ncbi:PREDICTED: uncharacterized protein LOC109590481 [Amphimedon queenslandica]|uniref:SWIM-type domain-containing protein n=1 Tax=Amphimedon queenslandica TaxID=400682 RepID=A0A1X7T0D3_AMPQE|nr:PREDICTED: uncharacterized protein LOC109590481 [Amphimedon queenslandica]|eukprot:XP_019861952.1 PREDICTED: uncharacterized protein LOC109590481 [Amphimedon queenslandica]